MTARSVHGRLLFRDRVDHRTYLSLLAAEIARRRWSLYSWCHMPNHVHLLVRTEEANLGRGIKAVHEAHLDAVRRRPPQQTTGGVDHPHVTQPNR